MFKINFKNIIERYYKIILTAVIFIVYAITMAPSVQQMNSGELAAVQCTLGIAHPTGYPLFTLIGFLFQLIPFSLSAIIKLNLLSALWSAASIYFYLLSMELVYENLYLKYDIKSVFGKKFKKIKNQTEQKDIDDQQYAKILAVGGSGFILAFNRTFWIQSTGLDVYSLHMALISIIVYFLFRTLFETDKSASKATTNWIIVSLFIALGFTNHVTTMLILPAAIILFLYTERINLISLRIIGVSALFFIVVLILFYLYLPTRAAMNPALNWGDPAGIENIYRHVSAQQYQFWLFSSIEIAEQKLIFLYENLPNEFLIIIFLFVAIGIVELIIRSRTVFFFVFVCILTSLLYAINYEMNDINPYLLLAYYSLSIISLFGIIIVYKFFRFIRLPKIIASLILGIFILAHGVWNFSKVDQSDVYIFEDYTKTILNSVEANSIVLSSQWDNFLSPSYYYQFVEKHRDDVIVINTELLRKSWYYKQLKSNNSNVFAGFEGDVSVFINSLKTIENGDEYNSDLIEKYFRSIQTKLITFNISEQNFYLGPEIIENELKKGELSLPKGYTVVPHMMLFKVVRGNRYVPAPDPDFTLRIPSNQNRFTDLIEKTAAQMLSNRAMYELRFRKITRAKLYTQKIANDFPDFTLPDRLKRILNN